MLVEQLFIESILGSSLFSDLQGRFSRFSGEAPTRVDTVG